MSVVLCDTGGKEDVHINDRLVSDGFADIKMDRFGDEVQQEVSFRSVSRH